MEDMQQHQKWKEDRKVKSKRREWQYDRVWSRGAREVANGPAMDAGS